MIITNELIVKGKSSNGGWSSKQLKLLGVAWPPQTGWLKKLIGKKVDEKIMLKFIRLKDHHL